MFPAACLQSGWCPDPYSLDARPSVPRYTPLWESNPPFQSSLDSVHPKMYVQMATTLPISHAIPPPISAKITSRAALRTAIAFTSLLVGSFILNLLSARVGLIYGVALPAMADPHDALKAAALEILLDPCSRTRRALGKALKAAGVDWVAVQKERRAAEKAQWRKDGW